MKRKSCGVPSGQCKSFDEKSITKHCIDINDQRMTSMRDPVAHDSVQEDLVVHAKESRLPRIFERINALFNCIFNSIKTQFFLHFTATSKHFT